jgi:hypothetical protein
MYDFIKYDMQRGVLYMYDFINYDMQRATSQPDQIPHPTSPCTSAFALCDLLHHPAGHRHQTDCTPLGRWQTRLTKNSATVLMTSHNTLQGTTTKQTRPLLFMHCSARRRCTAALPLLQQLIARGCEAERLAFSHYV